MECPELLDRHADLLAVQSMVLALGVAVKRLTGSLNPSPCTSSRSKKRCVRRKATLRRMHAASQGDSSTAVDKETQVPHPDAVDKETQVLPHDVIDKETQVTLQVMVDKETQVTIQDASIVSGFFDDELMCLERLAAHSFGSSVSALRSRLCVRAEEQVLLLSNRLVLAKSQYLADLDQLNKFQDEITILRPSARNPTGVACQRDYKLLPSDPTYLLRCAPYSGGGSLFPDHSQAVASQLPNPETGSNVPAVLPPCHPSGQECKQQ